MNKFTFMLFFAVGSTTVIADEPDAKTPEHGPRSVLFRRFLDSMTISPLKKKISTPPSAPPPPISPQAGSQPDASRPNQTKQSICPTCGAIKLAGRTCSSCGGSGTGGTGSSIASRGLQSGQGQSGQGQSGQGQSGQGQSGQGQSGQGQSGQGQSGQGQSGQGQSGQGQDGAVGLPSYANGRSQVPPSNGSAGGPAGSTQTGNSGDTIALRSAGGPSIDSGNSPAIPSSGQSSATTNRSSGASGRSRSYTPLGWEIVRPAGAGSPDWQSALGITGVQTDGLGDKDGGRRLEAGTIRSQIQTGPSNILILPPEIASVVYVLDCSSSMAGNRFDRVQKALVDAVGRMSAKQEFALLLFNTSALQIRGGGYRRAGSRGATILENELCMISPSGGTDPSDALLLAIQLKPKAIVILSDGEFEPQIVDRVTRLNRSGGKNTQINCVAIGTNIATLRQIAAHNGPGNYVEVP